jgi:NADH-quinone oxidoreductase subunit L
MLLLAALSTFLFFSWNPLSAANGWVSNLGQFSHASAWGTWAFIGSMAAASAGIAFAVCYNCWRQHIAEPQALWETTVQRFSQMYLTLVLIPFQQLLEWVARLSLQKMMLWLLVNPALAVANGVSKFDGKVLDNSVNYGAKITVIAAHIVGFVDRFFVDGAVNLLAWISKQIGARFRVPQNGNVQNYIWYALGLYLLWIVVG